MTAVTFDKEESLLRGHIPLAKLKKDVEELKPEEVKEIDFADNGYCTDTVIKVIKDHIKGALAELKTVNLRGCSLLTDDGMRWLAEILKGAKDILHVNINDCCNVTDTGLSLVVSNVNDMCRISYKGTSVRHIAFAKGKILSGSPMFSQVEEIQDYKKGNVLIVPHPSVERSVASCLSGKGIANNEGLHHYPAVIFKDDWQLNLNEVSLNNPLFDVMVRRNPVQVVIPFDASAEPKEISSHIIDTVTRIAIKEKPCPKMELREMGVRETHVGPVSCFMDMKSVTGLIFDVETGILTNRTIRESDPDEDIGCYFSRQPFSRSFPYFEVELVEFDGELNPEKEEEKVEDKDKKKKEKEDEKDGVILGCLNEQMFIIRNAMDSNIDKGGEVQAFEFKRIGDRFGFGIHGEWQSEYIPGSNCSFYSTRNGVEATDKSMLSGDPITTRNYYPCVSVMSKHVCKIKLLQYCPPPEEITRAFKVENKWIRTSYVFNCAISRDGLISTCAFSNRSEDSHYVSETALGTLDTPHTSCTFKVVDPGPGEKVVFGFGKERHKFGVDKVYLAFIGMDGAVKKGDSPLELKTKATKVEAGEEITFKWYIEKQPKDFGGTKDFKTEVYRNGKLYCETNYTYHFTDGLPTTRIIVKYTTGGSRKVRLLEHQPIYRQPGVLQDSITLGYLRRVILSDDGTMECGAQHGINTFGIFVGKTQFNKSMMYFEMEVLATPSRVTIGVSHYDKPPGFYLGMNQCEVGVHNTGEMSKISLGTKADYRVYKVGDVVGCGVEGDLDEDGYLIQEQEITVYFTKNGERMETTKLNYCSDGLYPSVMVEKPGCKIRLKNYYPEGREHKEAAHAKKESTEKKQKKEEEAVEMIAKDFHGCQFTVLGLESSSSNAKGKVQIVQGMVKMEDLSSLPNIQQITSSRQSLQKDLENLNLDEQMLYSQLCIAEENIQNLQKYPDRLNFTTADVNSDKGFDELRKMIEDTFLIHREFQKPLYRLPKAVPYLSQQIGEHLAKLKRSGSIAAACDDATTPTLYKEISKTFEGILTGEMMTEVLNMLYDQGALLVLKTDLSTQVVDINYTKEIMKKLEKISGTMMSEGKSTAVGHGSHIWTKETIKSAILQQDEAENQQLLQFLEGYLGLIKIPVWRQSEKDEHYLYTTASNISPPPTKLRDFWSKGESTKNFIVMQKTYGFIHEIPEHLVALVLSATSQYGRLIAMTCDGAVYQTGAVQTTIIQHSGIAGKKVLSVESKCYMPDQKTENMNELTESNVRDYTYQVMCLYTDFIDRIIKRQGLMPIISQNIPYGLVSVSIGCNHNWSAFENIEHVQSVCTLCNRCCDKGDKCDWNGIIGGYLRECCCNTRSTGCVDCGICVFCAHDLWNLRSELRPMPMVYSNQKSVPLIPMNPVTFDEVEFSLINGICPALCLKNIQEGTVVLAAPGKASTIGDLEKIQTILEKLTAHDQGMQIRPKDKVKIRLRDPLGAITLEQSTVRQKSETRIIYHSYLCREAAVFQEAGLIVYNSASSNMPVAQFMGPKPFSNTLKRFSFTIVDEGADKAITIGIAGTTYEANRQPGWNRWSLAYHADDGGIFIESGYSKTKKEVCNKGDVMAVELEVDTRVLRFFKNDVEMYQTTVNFPRGGYHPIIGLHSPGECVKLNEVHPWLPESSERDDLRKPKSLEAAKYGNLWICPANVVMMTKYGTRGFRGVTLLHNPTKSKIGYKMDPPLVEGKHLGENKKLAGILDSKESKIISVYSNDSAGIQDFEIHWLSLEKNREYTLDDIDAIDVKNFTTHKMRCEVSVGGNVGDVEALSKVSETQQPDKDMFMLEVLKNSELMEQYWIKAGQYKLEIHKASGEFSISMPKCPNYLYPQKLERGMKIIVNLEAGEKKLAEAVITEIYEGGGYCLEYTPDTEGENQILCYDENMIGVKEEDFNPEEKILLYKPDPTKKFLTRTFLSAPGYLISKGNLKALDAIDDNWKDDALEHHSLCSSDIRRYTVQEQLITYHSRTLVGWLNGYGANGHVDDAFVFLPSKLDQQFLTYPAVMNMFQDLAVHRLCSFPDQILHFQPSKKVNLRMPMHFVDMPGMTPNEPVPVNLSYTCQYQGWIYTALIGEQFLLPSYSKVFTDDMSSLSRKQIEYLMSHLLMSFTSLCSIYAAQHGGLPNQINPPFGTDKVTALIKHVDQPALHFKGKPFVETHSLIKQGRAHMCKAHHIALSGNEGMFDSDLTINFEYFEPYAELVHAFSWDLPQLPSIPKEFFSKFPNLQYFSLESSALKENPVFPEGISTLKELETIHMQKLNIKKLPKDILSGPMLKNMSVTGVPVNKLHIDWPLSSQLQKLSLHGLQLEKVPKEIGQLQELIELYLDYNPISTLPMEMASLQKLKILSVKGVPMLTFDGIKESITKDQYFSWHAENNVIETYLTKEVITQMFEEFDTNKNSVLELKELAQMNLKMFFSIPRFGINGKHAEGGGLPEVIYMMKSLEELYLNNQGITLINAEISNLVNLRVLSLAHCLLLEGISSTTGMLPNIKRINLHSCPSLRTPPLEVVGRGFESVKAYLKRLHGGFTECRRTKLMFVGLGEAGKTSLLQALMSATKKTPGTQNAQLTDGIDIKTWTVKSDEGLDIAFSAWDFAGQTVYYNTHQFFMSKRAVYMLLWNMRMGFEHAGLDFWLSSIACHAPETPILVIGTQSDQVPKTDIPEKDLKVRYPQIQSFHYVSSLTGDKIPELQKELLTVTLKQSYMGEKVPQVWLNLEKKILGERSKQSILDWSIIEDFAMEQGIYDDKDVKQAIKFLDDLGTVQYFDNDFLRDKVVINPQWIVNVMACVVSVKSSPIQKNDGRFLHENIKDVWKDYDESLHPWLLSLTEEFDLTFPLPGKPLNIVPCLLPLEPPSELKWPEADFANGIRENKMMYKFAYLPAGLFNRAQVRLFNFSDGKMIWKNGSFLKKNQHLALIKQESDTELVVLVQGPRPENVLLLVHEVFESLILESFHGVIYDYFVPCPDCISKEGTKDPCLFKAELIRRAKDLSAPFLQCTKYFHTVSMGQLLAMMPEDKDSDFDIHLQHSISALQSINNSMQFDCVVLYCHHDIPKEGQKEWIHPEDIRNDLVSWGYSVWMPDDTEFVKPQEMTLIIKNCKVIVCCISDQFERNEICHQMFLYAKEQLMKKFALAVIRPSLEWRNTDLGMRIGNPKMCMIKTPDRYHTKIGDLREIMEDTMTGLEMGNVDHPDIFISYCWQNSHDAVANGTQARHGALGYADPRDLKKRLEQKGLSCWIDIEQMGKYGLYQDIAVGLQNCKVIVACVSDEYVESDACMMELRFAVCNMQLPLVVVVVGTGMEWKKSEVSLLMRRSEKGAPKVYMQKENEEGYNVLYKYVVDALPTLEDIHLAAEKRKKEERKKRKEESKKKKASNEKHSFQEEYELIQRKFMRHLVTMTQQLDLQLLPRLLVFDFVKAGVRSKGTTETSVERPKTAGKPSLQSRMSNLVERATKIAMEEDEEEWQSEELCIKVLCENEEGWHVVKKPLTLMTRTSEEIVSTLKEAAPFLARFYAILKQSSIRLNCLNGKAGESFLNFLEQEGKSTTNFLKAYVAVHKMVASHEDNEEFIRQLDRCNLPSGKVAWLCEKHSSGSRITKLGVGSISVHGQGQIILNKEDELLKEYMKGHPDVERVLRFSRGEGERPPSAKGDRPVSAERPTSGVPPPKDRPPSGRRSRQVSAKTQKQQAQVNGDQPTDNIKKDGPTVQLQNNKVTTSTSQKTTPNTSQPQSPTSTSSKSSTIGIDQAARTARQLQRNYSKSGKQKSQACVLQ